MDRQLTVWAAPGLVLFVALVAFLVGGFPLDLPERESGPVVGSAEPPPDVVAAREARAAAGDEEAADEPAAEADAEEPVEAAGPEPDAPDDAGATEADAAPPAAGGEGPGVVTGRVAVAGDAPDPGSKVAVPASQRSECCGEDMDVAPRRIRVAPDGGVADVVVVIEADGAEADGAGTEVVMDQVCCRFEPHVLIVPEGGTVRYENSDETTHNVKTSARKNKNINNNMAAGSSTTTALPESEQFPVACDIHPWMKAQIYVAEYRTAAVTAADGTFRIEDVPPGTWKVELWSETLQPQERYEVTVRPGAATEVELAVGEGGGGRGGRRGR